IPVNRGEADVGHLIEAGQRLHHQLADHIGRDFIFAHGFQAPHDPRDRTIDALALDRTLAQGVVDRTLQLVAVEGLTAAFLLDHDQFAQLHAFKGGEAPAALWTMPAAADRGIVLGGTTVLHLAVVMSAEWAAHAYLLLLWIDWKTPAKFA